MQGRSTRNPKSQECSWSSPQRRSIQESSAPPDKATSKKDTKESLPRREEPHQESAMDEQAPPDSRPTSEKDTKKSLPRREEPHQESAMDEQQEYQTNVSRCRDGAPEIQK
ncbi:uncharacterized protein LOC116806334 isoform X8 [Drosophila grimshawi]|uniref:uncharacterized protein LOC116806334 isoform X8 n=1 Tax=Drosophila grimshawi TaxID=7222 RepID=UPI001C936F92|nr:uncharacterized protein LOC116806334 isoform X8 [Drosophila grimshawi]